MPSHEWGDEWFEKHGNDLNHAVGYCMDFWRKWGRIGSHGKEKYGTFRDHSHFYTGWWAIHSLVNPGYVYYQWPNWIYEIDLFLGKCVRFLKLYKPIQWYQSKIYNYAVQKMCKVADLEGYNLIKPGIFGKINGTEVHNRHWRTVV